MGRRGARPARPKANTDAGLNRHALLLGVALAALLTLPTATAGERSAAAGPTVHLLYLVPSDRPLRPAYAEAIADTFRTLRAWYRGQVGATFSLASPRPRTCLLPRRASAYVIETWTRIVSDAQACAPVAEGGERAVWVVYADVVHRCKAPDRIGAGTLGLTIMGRQDLLGLTGGRSLDDCGRDWGLPHGRFVGGAGHELGHAFGLPHPPGCDDDLPSCDAGALMSLGYAEFPRTYLRRDEIAQLRSSPYFR